ncbi:FG-GAP repeat protein [Algoriphagus aquaeductus]|uniref:FG-GAP repeat protein n=1 Tax=Algoriphagus aquaeductus TaxID=475299 RepID=A0A326RU79_9BACT|nr:FG-GAP repeat protein [Algoriphagus aquaeductus]
MKYANCQTYFFFLLALISCSPKADFQSGEMLFISLDSKKTGINFINKLTEKEEFNIIEYLYFYNGGGVAAGDINNDGLVDLYFSSNQLPNKLFLNKGGFLFEDITESSGTSSLGPWKTGVSMVDINGDGLLDIYVCRLGDWKGIKGKNELYINNGDLSFTESAQLYGLDFQGFSTQAAFFDYDRDGDLDMYLLNHAVHTENSYGRASLRYMDSGPEGDRLYRNNAEKGEIRFTPVTNEAGIFSSHIGYGLGVGITDINNDGWPDIYVSNDFNENDYLYINQTDGTFKEQISAMTTVSSRFSMGNDFADINNDGWIDFITLDMLPKEEKIKKMSAGEDSEEIYQLKLSFGFERQVSRNTLQLNNGNGTFSEIGQYSGIYATDWSWSALFADFDNDGWKDLFVSNGIVRRPNDLDYINFLMNPELKDGFQNKPDLRNLQLAKKMPPGDVGNFIFKNNGDLTFEDLSRKWGLSEKSISNGAVYVDLDNDGDLDLVVNNINEQAGIFQNRLDQISGDTADKNYLKVKFEGQNRNKFGIGARVEIYSKNQVQVRENYTSRGFQSAVAPELHFGVGSHEILDSVKIIWPSGKSETFTQVRVNSTLVMKETEATKESKPTPSPEKSGVRVLERNSTGLEFIHFENEYNDFNVEPLLPHKLSKEGPALTIGDLNGDGREDVFVGGASGQAGVVFLQNKEGKFFPIVQPLLEEDAFLEDVCAELLDVNGDGAMDLVVGRGGNLPLPTEEVGSTILYLNDGNGRFYKKIPLPLEINTQVSVVRSVDFNQDGLMDLMIGGRNVPGKYGLSPRSYLLKNLGDHQFVDVTKEVAPDLEYLGMVKDAVWTDLDLDGNLDLVVVGEWMPITVFLNKNGVLINETSHFGLDYSSGWWNSLAAADLNGDGYPDLVVGNLGLNSRLKTFEKLPVRMMVKDFDQNGSIEQIISYPEDGKYYSIASKDELTKQIPVLKKDFVNYTDFAGKTVEEIFRRFDLEGAKQLEAHQFESVVLVNQEGKKFQSIPLPAEAQFSPIEAILLTDVNQDGFPDLIIGGNNTSSAPYFGAYQGSWGNILTGTGQGDFRSEKKYTMKIHGDVKEIKEVRVGSQIWVIFAKNDAEMEVVKID